MRKYHPHTLPYLHETIALGSGSSDGICYPGPSNKTLAELTEAKFGAGLATQEIMQTKPGKLAPVLRDGWDDSILQALEPSRLR